VEVGRTAAQGAGVRAVGPGGTIRSATTFGQLGIDSTSDDLQVSHLHHFSGAYGDDGPPDATALRVTDGTVTVDQAMLRLERAGTGATGVDVAPAGGPVHVSLSGVSVIGPALGVNNGVRADCSGGGTADVTLLDTAVWGFATDLARSGTDCTVGLSYVRYGTRDAGGGAFADGTGVSSGPVGPIAEWGGWPLFGSPLIDAGSPTPAADPDEGDTYGVPRRRVVDGDGDGVARRDIGGSEYQRYGPLSSFLDAPATAAAGTPVVFDASRTNDWDQETLTFAWTVDGQPATAPGDGKKLTATFTTNGDHVVTMKATNPAGRSSAPQTATVAVTGATGPADGGQTQTTTTQTTTQTTTTPAPPTPPAVTSTPKPVAPAVVATLLSKRVSGGAVKVRVGCGTVAACKGTVVLKAGRATLGRAAFSLRAGATRTVTVKLGKAARRIVTRQGGKGVAVVVRVLRASGAAWLDGTGGRVRP
jgi:hypothetical protein